MHLKNDELQLAQTIKTSNKNDQDELETWKGVDNTSTLQRPSDTWWGSHFQSICSLLTMFSATCKFIDIITYTKRHQCFTVDCTVQSTVKHWCRGELYMCVGRKTEPLMSTQKRQ